VPNDGRDNCIRISDMLSDLEKNEQLLDACVVTRFELTKTVTE